MIRCPECGTEVQPTWDWCHACGWDPDGHRAVPAAPPPPPPAASTKGATSVVVVVLAVVGGLFGIAIVGILAVTFLGTPVETSRFESVSGAIDPEGASDVPALGELGDPSAPAGAPPTTPPADAPWTRFTAEDGSFSIDFPGVPEVQDLPNDEPTIARAQLIGTVGGRTSYGVMVTDYKPEYPVTDPTAGLDLFVERAFPAMGIQVSSRTPGNFAYATSIAFEGYDTTLGDTVEGVVFIEGTHRFYLLVATGRPGTPPETERFLSSLTLG